jgi:Na+-driven multidrug efflux pump
MLLFRVIQSFLNAQNKVWPMVYASVFASYIIQPMLLKVFVPALGLNGSAIAIDLTQYVMVGVLLIYIKSRKPHKRETWPGISREFVLKAIDQTSMVEFICLSLGGVMSLSEWWFWETTTFIVGTLGVIPLVVHTIAYNVSISFLSKSNNLV